MGDGRVWATAKARELYGVSSDQKLTFDFFLGLDHPEDRERVRGAVQDAIRTGDETAAEYRIVLPDGAVRYIAARGRRQSGQAGESDHLMGVSSGRHSLHFGGQ